MLNLCGVRLEDTLKIFAWWSSETTMTLLDHFADLQVYKAIIVSFVMISSRIQSVFATIVNKLAQPFKSAAQVTL